MGTYRMFVLDESNWLIGGHIIAAESDSEALETAVRMGEGATHELWDEDRLVGRTEKCVRG